MKYRRVAGIEAELSVVGFGCWAVGGKWWGDDVTDEESVAAIRRAFERGVTVFDTAPLYGHGHADEVLARALGPRLREVVVATKVGVRWDGVRGHATSDLHPDHVVKDCEASLERLGLERIDLLQVHWPCERSTPLEDTLGALVRLKEAGKIGAFGLCNYAPDDLARARALAPVATLQTPYSMIRREFEQALRAVACAGNEPPLGVLAYEPLARGLLTGKFNVQPVFPESDLRSRDERFKGQGFHALSAFARTIARAARQVNLPASALAIGWVVSRPGVTLALAGAKTRAQVDENVKAHLVADRADFWKAMDPIVDAFTGR